MTPPKSVVWKLEPHTKAKHEILRRYLGGWFPILGKYNKRIVYIDGFCGPGKYENGEDGSPIIALQIAKGMHKKGLISKATFLFVEDDKARIEKLEQEITALNPPNDFETHQFNTNFEDAMNYYFNLLQTKGT